MHPKRRIKPENSTRGVNLMGYIGLLAVEEERILELIEAVSEFCSQDIAGAYAHVELTTIRRLLR